MFVFSKDVLIHILNKIKIQLNNKVSSEYTVNGQTYHKVLSEVEYNEFYDDILSRLDISDQDLLSMHDILYDFEYDDRKRIAAADLGRQIREYYLDDTMHRYIYKNQLNNRVVDSNELFFLTDSDELYGLSEEQMIQLRDAYCHTLINDDFSYAKLEELDNCLINCENKAFESLADRLLYIDSVIDEAEQQAKDVDDTLDCYGVRIDFEEDNYIRTHRAKNFFDNEEFNSIMPWAGMRRCTVRNGNVTSYFGDVNFKEDGSMGDVMVEIPKFYYKVTPIRLEPAPNGGQQIVEAEWMISSKNLDTFKVHPAFIRNGVEVDHVYVGAYEAVLFDISANSYVNGYNLDLSRNEDLLGSVMGYKPIYGSSFHYVAAKTLMDNRKDSRYSTIDFTTMSAIQLLYLIEYADFNSQETIGFGLCDKTEVSGSTLSYATGGTSEFGNDSAYSKEGYVSYRGIENLWGNHWTIACGIIIDWPNKTIYWANSAEYNLVDGLHKEISFKINSTGGYISRIGYDFNNDFCFIPTETSGTSNTGLCDTFISGLSSYTGFLICDYGGRCMSSAGGGMFAIHINIGPYSVNTASTRIQFYK